MEGLILKEQELYQYQGDDAVVSSIDMRDSIGIDLTPEWVLYSGLPKMDDAIKGFYPGEVTVISGITGEGKTLLSQTLTTNFYKKNNLSVWFSYEVRPKLFFSQFGMHLPEFYLPSKMKEATIPWIYERVWEAKLKYKVKAVFIDHLHYLLDMMRVNNVSLQIGGLMRAIVNMAHDLQVAVFVVAHMAKIQSDKEPGKGDARDSSFVEQEPDNVFYVWRSKKFLNSGTIKIVKNRREAAWNVKVPVIKQGVYFVEAEFNHDV
jgi:replicative DNA helicase